MRPEPHGPQDGLELRRVQDGCQAGDGEAQGGEGGDPGGAEQFAGEDVRRGGPALGPQRGEGGLDDAGPRARSRGASWGASRAGRARGCRRGRPRRLRGPARRRVRSLRRPHGCRPRSIDGSKGRRRRRPAGGWWSWWYWSRWKSPGVRKGCACRLKTGRTKEWGKGGVSAGQARPRRSASARRRSPGRGNPCRGGSGPRAGSRPTGRASKVHGAQPRTGRCPHSMPGAGVDCPVLSAPVHSVLGPRHGPQRGPSAQQFTTVQAPSCRVGAHVNVPRLVLRAVLGP